MGTQLKMQALCLHLHRSSTKETAVYLFFEEVIYLLQRPLKSMEIFFLTSVSFGYSPYCLLFRSNNSVCLMMLLLCKILSLTEDLENPLNKSSSQDQRTIYDCSHVFLCATNCSCHD